MTGSRKPTHRHQLVLINCQNTHQSQEAHSDRSFMSLINPPSQPAPSFKCTSIEIKLKRAPGMGMGIWRTNPIGLQQPNANGTLQEKWSTDSTSTKRIVQPLTTIYCLQQRLPIMRILPNRSIHLIVVAQREAGKLNWKNAMARFLIYFRKLKDWFVITRKIERFSSKKYQHKYIGVAAQSKQGWLGISFLKLLPPFISKPISLTQFSHFLLISST